MNHAPHLFAVEGDDLLLNGVPVRLLAARVGGGAFYAYDSAAMSKRVAELRAAMPARLQLHYAMKANPMPAVVRHLSAQLDGVDVASVLEMQVALDAGVAPAQISFAGPGKSDREVRQAVAAGCSIWSARVCAALAASGRLALTQRRTRVNPRLSLRPPV